MFWGHEGAIFFTGKFFFNGCTLKGYQIVDVIEGKVDKRLFALT